MTYLFLFCGLLIGCALQSEQGYLRLGDTEEKVRLKLLKRNFEESSYARGLWLNSKYLDVFESVSVKFDSTAGRLIQFNPALYRTDSVEISNFFDLISDLYTRQLGKHDSTVLFLYKRGGTTVMSRWWSGDSISVELSTIFRPDLKRYSLSLTEARPWLRVYSDAPDAMLKSRIKLE